jgi:hypothetical protein
MNNILLIIILFFTSKTHSQKLEDFLIPSNYKKIADAKGDLDKDGIDEFVFAYETNKIDEDSSFSRELYICKKVNSKIKIWKKNATVLWKTKDFGMFAENQNVGLKISNNTLIISQTSYESSRGYQSYKDVFRFQNNDWFLIGSTCVSQYNCLFEDKFDINFSKRKVNVIKHYEICEDGVGMRDYSVPPQKDEILSFKYPFKTIPRMDGFTPGKNVLLIPGRKDDFLY